MNNDYNNFNNQNNQQPAGGYDPNQNQQPYQQQPYQQPIQPQYAQYVPVQQPQQESNTMGVLSIVFSALGIFCCGIPFGITGIILGSLYAKKNSKSPLGWIGLGLGILAIILAIGSLVAMGGVEGYTDMLEQITNNI